MGTNDVIHSNVSKSVIRILHRGTKLYRYNLSLPPTEWSTSYKSLAYSNFDLGEKNSCCAFFSSMKKMKRLMWLRLSLMNGESILKIMDGLEMFG